jgi:deoxyribodipyrimidine photo-lyase
MERQPIQWVWFKRDLRLRDHAPLEAALQTGLPTLLLYFFEPEIRKAPDWDLRHERFIYQSLCQMNLELQSLGHRIWILDASVISFLDLCLEQFDVQTIFSYQETGLEHTYLRDKTLKNICREKGIQWKEFQNNGVIRGIKDRKNWSTSWERFMHSSIPKLDLDRLISPTNRLFDKYPRMIYIPSPELEIENPHFQKGGERMAWRYLISFREKRLENYSQNISKPLESRTSCSRLSPYLAWGNLSIRQVYQYCVSLPEPGNKPNLQNFLSRVHWHCHFIQKLETEGRIEKENLNRAFNILRKDWNESYFLAWKEGKTGFPLIDACMIAVQTTGYLNFRMRSLLVSFLTHHLWLDWRPGAWFLARQFLDYEPGIHFSQFQMQSGTMGVNTLRIYNPVKQSQEKDPEGAFIKLWIPALKKIPSSLIHEPWKMSIIEQELYSCYLGRNYPYPIVDLERTGRFARQTLWSVKKSNEARKENQEILNRLTMRKTEEESDRGHFSSREKRKI